MNYKGPTLSENTFCSETLGCPVDVLGFSGMETGTHKIIKAREASRRCPGSTELVAITSGNYGAALKRVAEEQQRRVHLVMGDGRPDLKEKLRGPYSTVLEIENLMGQLPGGRRTAIVQRRRGLITDLSRRELEEAMASLTGKNEREFTNVTSHVDILRNSAEKKDLRDNPIYEVMWYANVGSYRAVFVPAGGGELLHDVAANFLYSDTWIFGVCPKGHPLITGTTFESDNFVESYADKLVCPTHQMGGLLQTASSARSSVGIRPIEYLSATEQNFRHAHRLAQQAGLDCEPSGAAACVSLIKTFRERHRLSFGPEDRVLIVNTGNGERYIRENL